MSRCARTCYNKSDLVRQFSHPSCSLPRRRRPAAKCRYYVLVSVCGCGQCRVSERHVRSMIYQPHRYTLLACCTRFHGIVSSLIRSCRCHAAERHVLTALLDLHVTTMYQLMRRSCMTPRYYDAQSCQMASSSFLSKAFIVIRRYR